MNKRIIKQIVTVFVLSAIPSILSYMASSSLIFDKMKEYGIIGDSINIPFIQDCCLWIGIIISALTLSLNLIITKAKYDEILEQRNLLIKMNKSVLSSSLGKRFLSDSSTFDIRIFIPKHPILYKFLDKLNKTKASKLLKNKKVSSKKFIIKNIDLIAEQGTTKNLQFEVEPKRQGLVGLCYEKRAMVFDDELENTNSLNYNLNNIQIDKTTNLKWSICCPVFDDKDAIVAIFALDGKTKITIDKEKEAALREEVLAFSRMLFDYVPQLFKR